MRKLLIVTFCLFIAGAFYHVDAQVLPTSQGADIGVASNPQTKLNVFGDKSGITVRSYVNNASHLNLNNDNGYWHLSGPRSSEGANRFSIFWNNGTTYFRHLTIKDDGNFGVGTDNPEYKLQVHGVTGGSQTLAEFNKVGAGAQNPIIQLASNYTTGLKIGHENYFKSVYLDNSYGNADKISLKLKGSTKMVILNSGGVGIGTANPGAFKLAVNGDIRAKEIKVETGWSDFVFEDDYNLPTLGEVEENGVSLGEMDSKLLQKIEELTLYLIEQQKEIKTLKEKMATLEKAADKF